MRREYLFVLAHVCHLAPAAVDDLNLYDFAALADDTDAYLQAMKKGA